MTTPRLLIRKHLMMQRLNMKYLENYVWQKQPLSIAYIFGDIGVSDDVCVDAIALKGGDFGEIAIINREQRELLVAYKKVSYQTMQVEDCDPARSEPINIKIPDTKGQASISNLEDCYWLYRDVPFTHAVLTGVFRLAQTLGVLKGHALIEKATRINKLIEQYIGQEPCTDYHQTLFNELTYLARIIRH